VTTILKSLADLPVKGVPATQYERERAEAKRLNRESHGRMRKPGKLAAAAETAASITWLDPPVRVGNFRVVGIASDASDDVKREYGVMVSRQVASLLPTGHRRTGPRRRVSART
jgi:hypothetical protein